MGRVYAVLLMGALVVFAGCAGNASPLPGGNQTACPAIYMPVCGMDNHTYGNDCVANRSGVAIDYMGACGGNGNGILPQPGNTANVSGPNQGNCMGGNCPMGGTITAADVAAHSSPYDCWVAYQGKVYDITAYVPNHPGYRLMQYCGSTTAFEQAFLAQHGTSKVNMLEQVGVFKGNLG